MLFMEHLYGIRSKRLLEEEINIASVSYTHLDVYKRQEHILVLAIYAPRHFLIFDLSGITAVCKRLLFAV